MAILKRSVCFCHSSVQKCSEMLDRGDLRFFLELARTGTLAAAGRKLGVDNTTVGRRLTALERDLSSKLFARTPDGLVLTAAGESIRTAGEEMEQALLRGEQRALGADRKLSGQVRVATTEMLGEVVVLPAVRSLHARHPQIRVDLMTGTGRLDVARREADVALRYARPESGDLIARRAGRGLSAFMPRRRISSTTAGSRAPAGFPGTTSSATTRASAIGALGRWAPSLCAMHASCCAPTAR